MRIQNRKVYLLLLLLWAVGVCLSISASKLEAIGKKEVKNNEKNGEQLNQEDQGRSIAWSEPTTPRGATVSSAEKLLPSLVLFCSIYLHNHWDAASTKSYRKHLAYVTLTEQFHILPNAP